MSDYDTTEKVERTDVGYRLTIESTRGTGTRDQDKVKFEQRTEGLPDFEFMIQRADDVKGVMKDLRAFDPDSEESDE